MTNEQLTKALQIKKDIEVLQGQTLRRDASTELTESWKDWVNSNLKRLKKEFEEL